MSNPSPMLPPPPPRSSSSASNKRKRADDDDARAGSSSPSKRSVAGRPPRAPRSSSESSFTESTKKKTKRVDGQDCWVCEANPVDIAHVIGQKDLGFSSLRSRNLLSFDNLSDESNAIPLCGCCHKNFDDPLHPGFLFIPTDLDFFIAYEKEDQKRRRTIGGDSGEFPGRSGVPSADEYRNHQRRTGAISEEAESGLYFRYILRRYLSPHIPYDLGVFHVPKPWHGSPSAAFRRSLLVLGNLAVPPGAIPKQIRQKLQTLNDLWMDLDFEEPVESIAPVVSSAAPPEDSDTGGSRKSRRSRTLRSNRRNEQGGSKSDEDKRPAQKNPQGYFTTRPQNPSQEETTAEMQENQASSPELRADSPPSLQYDQHTSECPSEHLLDTNSNSDPPLEDVENDREKKKWAWGPRATSQNAMDFFSSVKRVGV